MIRTGPSVCIDGTMPSGLSRCRHWVDRRSVGFAPVRWIGCRAGGMPRMHVIRPHELAAIGGKTVGPMRNARCLAPRVDPIGFMSRDCITSAGHATPMKAGRTQHWTHGRTWGKQARTRPCHAADNPRCKTRAPHDRIQGPQPTARGSGVLDLVRMLVHQGFQRQLLGLAGT